MPWPVFTDLTDDWKGPTVEFVLAGTACDLVREIPLDQKTRGVLGDLGDGQGHRHISGLELMVRIMNARFAHLDDGEVSRQLMGMYTVKRRPGETMDACIARCTVTPHRVASINGVTIGPGQCAFFLMAGAGCTQASMWNVLYTLSGRLPTDEVQFQQVIEQLRRYGHMVEQHQPYASHQGRHMPTGLDLDGIHQIPWGVQGMHLPTGITAPAGVGGGGASGTPPVDSGMPPPPAITEHCSIVDDSDTSGEESDGEMDNYPDPHPADPGMTGWSTNQIGCYFYGRYKHFLK